MAVIQVVHVQHSTGVGGNGGGTGAATCVAMTGPSTKGNTLIAVCSAAVSSSGGNFTESSSLGYTRAVQDVAQSNVQTAIFYKPNCAANETMPSFLYSLSSTHRVMLWEFYGLIPLTSALDRTGGNHGAGTAGLPFGFVVTGSGTDSANGGDLLITSDAFSFGSNYVELSVDTYNNGATPTGNVNNDSASQRTHYRFAYGFPSSHAAADTNTPTSNQVGTGSVGSSVLASFKASPVAAVAGATFAGTSSLTIRLEVTLLQTLDLNRPRPGFGVPHLLPTALKLRLLRAQSSPVPVVYQPVNVGLSGTSSLSMSLRELHRITVTMAGASSLTSTLRELNRITLSVSGTATLSTTLRELHRLTVTLTGTSSLSANPVEEQRFNVTLQGVGHLAAQVVEYHRIVVGLAGHGNLSVSASEYQRLQVSVNGVGHLSASLTEYHRFSLALAGRSTLAASVQTSGATSPITATLHGSSTLSNTLTKYHRFTTSLAGRSTLTVRVGERRRVLVTFSGIGHLAPQVREVVPFALDVNGASTLSSDVATQQLITLVLHGTSALDTETAISFEFPIYSTSTLQITIAKVRPTLSGTRIFGETGTLAGSSTTGRGTLRGESVLGIEEPDAVLTGERLDEGSGTAGGSKISSRGISTGERIR